MNNDIAKEILDEITTYCFHCSEVNCCQEDECILYRIEQLTLEEYEN